MESAQVVVDLRVVMGARIERVDLGLCQRRAGRPDDRIADQLKADFPTDRARIRRELAVHRGGGHAGRLHQPLTAARELVANDVPIGFR